MANTGQDEILKDFLQISGQQAAALSDVTMSLADVLAQVQELRAGVPEHGTKATSSTIGSASAAHSDGDTFSSVASAVLKTGFGLAPLVSGLIGLFGGGDAPPAPALVKYVLPSPVDLQGAETESGIAGMDYDQSGLPRVYRAASAARPAAMPESSFPGTSTGTGASAQGAQITVNVQAMDARSFMDRSNDIALAVRDAMLNMNAINDVVNEL